MYLISEFANIFHISTNTLRFYEKKGIFMPDYKDPVSGYRYYTDKQILEFSFLMTLKDINLSLDDIRIWKKGLFSESEMIEQLTQMQTRTNYALNYMKAIEHSKKPGFIYTQSYPPFYTAQKHLENCTISELQDSLCKMYILLQTYCQPALANPHTFVEFINDDFVLNGFDCILHLPIVPLQDDESLRILDEQGITFDTYSHTHFVCSCHCGNYDTLQTTYQRVYNYLKEHNLTVAGYPTERYLQFPPALESITEIRIPIN